jgi:RNase P/RNase MRP subunit p29
VKRSLPRKRGKARPAEQEITRIFSTARFLFLPIGCRVEITFSPSRSFIGVKGTVIQDEKKYVIVRDEASGRILRIPKMGTIFRFMCDRDVVEVPGELIFGSIIQRVRRLGKGRGWIPWLAK